MADASDARIEAATAQAVAAEATSDEIAASLDNRAVANAMERVAEAEQTADQVALAALHTAIGQRVDELRTACESRWTAHEQVHQTIRDEMARMQATLSGIEQAMLTLQQPPAIPAITAVSSNPETSEVTAVTVNPEAVENAAPTQENPAAPGRQKRPMRLL